MHRQFLRCLLLLATIFSGVGCIKFIFPPLPADALPAATQVGKGTININLQNYLHLMSRQVFMSLKGYRGVTYLYILISFR